LFVKYYNELLLYTLCLSKNKTIAEEIVAIAFYRALHTADAHVHQFKAWLLTVCRNEYFSYCRKKKYEPLCTDPLVSDPSQDVLAQIIRDEEYRALYRAISLLKAEQREVILLRYFSALSTQAIAETIGKSQSNVKVLLHRARANLKKILEGSI